MSTEDETDGFKNTARIMKYMSYGQEDYDKAIKFFGSAQSAVLYHKYFATEINGEKFNIFYNFGSNPFKDILKAVAQSIEELMIVECPFNTLTDSLIQCIFGSQIKLRKVIILDKIHEQYIQWIRRHSPHVHLIFAVPYLSKLHKFSTYNTLVFDQIAYESLLIPFKDLASFQSIRTLNIHGSFKNDDFHKRSIQKFVQFINGFPKLKSIEANFKLQTIDELGAIYQDSYDGLAFYETMKGMKAKRFKHVSKKVHGKIHFEAKINSFQKICCSIKDGLNQCTKPLKPPPIEYDEKNSIIQRKFSIHDRLLIVFSITPSFCSRRSSQLKSLLTDLRNIKIEPKYTCDD